MSFDDEQIFSMEAGKVRSKANRVYTTRGAKLLKFSAIYGANASGKTNLVRAFDFAQKVIVKGIPKGSNHRYCRLNPKNKEKPSKFEFTILLDDKKYIYGFELLISSVSFRSEYLMLESGTSTKQIFRRDICAGEYKVDTFFKPSSLSSRLEIYAEDIKTDDSVLFLRLMNQNKDSLYDNNPDIAVFKNLFHWFKYKLSVNYPDSPITDYAYLMDSKSISEIGQLMSAFGTGISEVVVAEVPLEKLTSSVPKKLLEKIIDDLHEQQKQRESQDMSEEPAVVLRSAEDNTMFIIDLASNHTVRCKTLEFKHEKSYDAFLANEESDGTIRLFDLIGVLLSKDSDKLVIIDEINLRLHPLLTYRFVEEYLKLASSRNMQLIVTTHESALMDFDLLRKDEICFVNKEESGTSTIFSLDKFNERFDKKVSKAYLAGQYGALPRFSFN